MREPVELPFLGKYKLKVAYLADFPRGPDGLCAFCHGDPCNEHSPPESDISDFYLSNPEALTCPMCDGRPS